MAADRALATVEVHASNDFYGHATVLKEYAGLPPKRPLKAAIEHGAPVTDLIWQVDLQRGCRSSSVPRASEPSATTSWQVAAAAVRRLAR